MSNYIIKKAIFVRGKAYSVGSGIELNEREAKELLTRGVVAEDDDISLDITPIEELKKNDLVEHATSLGIDVPSKATKEDILELIREIEQ